MDAMTAPAARLPRGHFGGHRWPAPTTREEEAELGSAIRAGGPGATAARNRLASAHLALALRLAARLGPRLGLDLEDAFGEAQLGLLRAAGKFDPGVGVRFSTYAGWWIRQRVEAAAHRHRGPVSVPRYTHDRSRGPTPYAAEAERGSVPAADVTLHQPADYRTPDPAEAIEPHPYHRLDDEVRAALRGLTARESDAVARYFGLLGDPEPIRAIAAGRGVGAKTVEDTIDRAIRKLRVALRREIGGAA